MQTRIVQLKVAVVSLKKTALQQNRYIMSEISDKGGRGEVGKGREGGKEGGRSSNGDFKKSIVSALIGIS